MLQPALQEASETERAEMRLLCVCPARLIGVVDTEVERRTAWFTTQHEQSPYSAGRSPRRAALESVYADLTAGRLR